MLSFNHARDGIQHDEDARAFDQNKKRNPLTDTGKLAMTNAILECMIERIAQTQIVSEPIDHLHIEEFPPDKEAHTLAGEFAAWQDAPWHSYDNAIEHKKTCNTWNSFEAATYRYFLAVNSQAMCRAIEEVKPASIENRENMESLKCAGINILPRLPNNS